MIVSVHQPNYLPWVGLFHKMALSDVFVIFDDVQLVRGKSYVTRTRIKTPNGTTWLTVPVLGKGDFKNINEVEIVTTDNWRKKHLKSIDFAYRKAKYYSEYIDVFREIYAKEWTKLVDLNCEIIRVMNKVLDIRAELVFSSKLSDGIERSGLDKIMQIVKEVKADTYLTGTGKGSQRYMDEEVFKKAGIQLQYQDFVHPIYLQLWGGEFVENLSMVDLMFNTRCQFA